MGAFGGFGVWPGVKRKRIVPNVVPPTPKPTPTGPTPPAGVTFYTPYTETNKTLPGMQVNEYSGLTFGSGSAGQQTGSGVFGYWRGRADDMICAHSDNNDDALNLWQFQFEGHEYAKNWNKHVDISIGAFGKGYGGNIVTETWKGAGRGDYDERWKQTLINMRNRLHTRVGPNGQPPKVFIRFAHEWNGNWYPWSASNYWLYTDNMNGQAREVSSKADFKAAWVRFRALQREYYPEAFIVSNVNRTGEGWSASADNPSGKWTDFIPDPDTYDVYGVDYYNWWKPIFTKAEWDESLNQTYSYSDPKGLNAHQALAIQIGKPMSFSEWGGVSTADGATFPTPSPNQELGPGDSPVFIEEMYKWFAANAGSGPGQCLYECYWSVLMPGGDQSGMGNDKFHLYHDPATYGPTWYGPDPQVITKMPLSAAKYQELWGSGVGAIPTGDPAPEPAPLTGAYSAVYENTYGTRTTAPTPEPDVATFGTSAFGTSPFPSA